jgi:hypothetical protein
MTVRGGLTVQRQRCDEIFWPLFFVLQSALLRSQTLCGKELLHVESKSRLGSSQAGDHLIVFKAIKCILLGYIALLVVFIVLQLACLCGVLGSE